MRKIFVALSLVPLLSSCTLFASNIAVDPPGVATTDFRTCLDKHQFFDGLGDAGSPLRSQLAGPFVPDKRGRLKTNDAEFVIEATRIIYRGVLPALSYSGGLGDVESPYKARPGDWKLNRFLDCYIGEVGPATNLEQPNSPAAFGVEDQDAEGRLLRGHILLVLLTKYGVQLLVSHPSGKQVKQAELLLGHVIDAEKSLRSVSAVMSPDIVDAANAAATADGLTEPFKLSKVDPSGPPAAAPAPAAIAGPPAAAAPAPAKLAAKDAKYVTYVALSGKQQITLHWYNAVTRVLRVFQVGVDDEQIDIQQTLDRASNLLEAFSNAFKGFVPILKDALSGLVTVQKTQIYGDAFLRDARETLAVHRSGVHYTGTGTDTEITYEVAKTRAGWKLWDDQLNESCAVLATVAQKDKAAGICAGAQSAVAK